MKKTILLLFVILTMLTGFAIVSEAANDYTLSGTTFTVYTADGLMEVAQIINGESGDTSVSYTAYNIEIANDIDMSGKTWKPIGKNDTYIYTGAIDGNGYTISNITRENYPSTCLGFVGVAGLNVKIQNLNLENVTLTSNRTGTAYAGGLIGKAKGAGAMTISGCSVDGYVATNLQGAGGLVGAVTSIYSKLSINNCTSGVNTVATESNAGAYVGYITSGAEVTTTGCSITADYSLGGTIFDIYTANGLMNAASKVNTDTAFAASTINILKNINMSGKSWVPIGKDATYAFTGTVNGGGYIVSNLTATNYAAEYLGFVGVAGNGAVVKNLHLTNLNFNSAKRCVAGIIANVTSTATVSGCTVKGNIYSGVNYAGGLVAVVSSASSNITITNCAVDANISAAAHSAAGIIAGDIATGYKTNDLTTFPTITASKVFVNGNFSSVYRVASFMGYNFCVNASFTDCLSLATLEFTNASENGAIVAVDNYSKFYFENCMVFSDLTAFYNLTKTTSVQTVEFKNCLFMKDSIGKNATIARYNKYGYYEYDSSATYKYTVIADIIVDGVGPKFTPFTVSNTSYRAPIIQYNLPSETEENLMSKIYSKGMSMFTDGSVQESFVHKHSWGTGTVKTEATYTDTGITAYACTKCNAVKNVETPCKTSTITWDYDNTTKTLTISGEGIMGKFMTPSMVPWKAHSKELTKVIIEEGIVSICDYAFYDCISLTEITIPEGIKSIGTYAFHNCKSLSNVTLPSTVTGIYNHAFEYCSSLASINIPASVTTMGYGVFRYAKNATPVIQSSSSKYIVSGNCLIETSSKKVIAGFGNSIIPTDASVVTTLGRCAFQGCTGLQSIEVPSNVTSLLAHVFAECTKLTKITLSNNITAISEGAFSGCSSINNVKVPDSVTSVAALAFNDCISMEAITLPASLTSVDISAFEGCTALIKATYGASCSDWNSVTVKDGNSILEEKVLPVHTYSGVTCSACGDVKPLEISGVSIVLKESIAVNILVDESYFKNGYTFSKLVVGFEGETYTYTSLPTASGGIHTFTFDDIYPRLMGKHMIITLYAKCNSITYKSVTREISAADYCYDVLGDESLTADEALRTLVVDMLNYSSAAHLYASTRKEETTYLSELTNFNLTQTQASWATKELPAATKIPLQTVPEGVSESWTSSVTWQKANLRFEDIVLIKIKMNIDDFENLDGLYVKVTTPTNSAGWTIPQSKWIQDNGIYIYFDGLTAHQLREDVYFTMYDSNDLPISYTLTYGVEYYAKTLFSLSDTSDAAKRVVMALLLYGDSAKKYSNQ